MRLFLSVLASIVITTSLLFADSSNNKNIETANITSETLSKTAALNVIKSTFRILNTSQNGGMGSGVMIYSNQRADKSKDKAYYSYILTCHHVTGDQPDAVSELFIYLNNREIVGITGYSSEVVITDRNYDIALLEIKTNAPFKNTSQLISDEEFSSLSLYDNVYISGCALGAPPFIAAGNFSSFDFQGHYMSSAALIFGDSGGGLFSASGRILGLSRLVPSLPNGGVFSQAGLFVKQSNIKKWLRIMNFGFLFNANDGSSLDLNLKIREEIQKKLDEEKREKALKDKLKKEERKDDAKRTSRSNSVKPDLNKQLFPLWRIPELVK